MTDPQSSTTAYQEIVDQLACETRLSSACAKRIAENTPFPVHSEQSEFNELLASLSERQRDLTSKLLIAERHDAIHDALAVLSWWVDCRNVGLVQNGKPMQVDFSGMGLHGDYVGRCDGWRWPRGEA